MNVLPSGAGPLLKRSVSSEDPGVVYRRGGFTLTELLVGIAALGVLTSIAGAEMFEQRRRAYDAVAQSCARDIRHHQALALADQQRFKNFDLFAQK